METKTIRQPKIETELDTPTHMQTLYKLAASNDKLAEANLCLSRGNEELIQLMKALTHKDEHPQRHDTKNVHCGGVD